MNALQYICGYFGDGRPRSREAAERYLERGTRDPMCLLNILINILFELCDIFSLSKFAISSDLDGLNMIKAALELLKFFLLYFI